MLKMCSYYSENLLLLLREALLTFAGAVKLMFPFVRSSFFVRKIIDFCREYMNPWHVLEAIETLKTWFLQIPRKVKLRLKAGLFGDPVLKLFFEKRCKNVPIVIIVSPAWKWLSSECRNCDVSTTYSSCLLMKWQCRRFAHPCPAGICLVRDFRAAAGENFEDLRPNPRKPRPC